MIIDKVTLRKSGSIAISYTDGGVLCSLLLTPQEIVELYNLSLKALNSGPVTYPARPERLLKLSDLPPVDTPND